MISTDELAALRAVQTAALPDTCTIQTCSVTSDGLGGQTATWSTLSAGVACRIGPAGSVLGDGEREIANRLAVVNPLVVTFPALTAITEQNRIVVGSRTFEVKAVIAHSWETARRVLCAEVL